VRGTLSGPRRGSHKSMSSDLTGGCRAPRIRRIRFWSSVTSKIARYVRPRRVRKKTFLCTEIGQKWIGCDRDPARLVELRIALVCLRHSRYGRSVGEYPQTLSLSSFFWAKARVSRRRVDTGLVAGPIPFFGPEVVGWKVDA
jgi:hypothetical protein